MEPQIFWKGPEAWFSLSPKPVEIPVSYTRGERELLSLLNITSRWIHRSQTVRGQWRECRASELGDRWSFGI